MRAVAITIQGATSPDGLAGPMNPWFAHSASTIPTFNARPLSPSPR